MSTNYNINKTEEEWRKELSPEQYHILREAGTERPHTGKYNMHFEDGEYHCAGAVEKGRRVGALSTQRHGDLRAVQGT